MKKEIAIPAARIALKKRKSLVLDGSGSGAQRGRGLALLSNGGEINVRRWNKAADNGAGKVTRHHDIDPVGFS